MSTALYWFRNDLRLHDQPGLRAACAAPTSRLLPVYFVGPPAQTTRWGFARMGRHRRAWRAATLRELGAQLAALHCPLLLCRGPAVTQLPALARAVGAATVFCEDIAAPEERAEVDALRAAGLDVRSVWHGSLLDPARLPFAVHDLPQVFTSFRRAVEQHAVEPAPPLPTPQRLPPWPALASRLPGTRRADGLAALAGVDSAACDARSCFAYSTPRCRAGESAALRHLARYLERGLPHSYKRTRDALADFDASSKFSPWLATGALSPRTVLHQLRDFESRQGASDGSYWLWFELLWRDYFRFLHLQHGRRLYAAGGLGGRGGRGAPAHDAQAFARWCEGRSGEPLVDAGMRELRCTGYISNRMRQIVASHLVHELGCDWRAGAAWFEAQLIDYDVYSNQGNWLYIAGRGTDPRGGRRFDVAAQAARHDAQGDYRRRWSTAHG